MAQEFDPGAPATGPSRPDPMRAGARPALMVTWSVGRFRRDDFHVLEARKPLSPTGRPQRRRFLRSRAGLRLDSQDARGLR